MFANYLQVVASVHNVSGDVSEVGLEWACYGNLIIITKQNKS